MNLDRSRGRAVAAPCPCGSGRACAQCCGRYHAGTPAPDAEALMRSRYSAYALGLEPYLLATWHPSTRPAAVFDSDPSPRWIRLAVLGHTNAGDTATVRFVATYRIEGRAHKLSETSRFVREDGRWYYVDGEVGDGTDADR